MSSFLAAIALAQVGAQVAPTKLSLSVEHTRMNRSSHILESHTLLRFFLVLVGLLFLGASVFAQDTDNDGLSDADETGIHNTDPNDPDSDDDSMKDGYEVVNSHNPLVAEIEIDPDLDGYPNAWEFAHGTDGGDVSSKPVWAATQTGPGYYIVDGTLGAETDYEKLTIASAYAAAQEFAVIEVKPGSFPGLSLSKRVVLFSSEGVYWFSGNVTTKRFGKGH